MTKFVDFLCLESGWKIKEIVIAIVCHKSWQFGGDVCLELQQTGNPRLQKNCHEKVGGAEVRRLKGGTCQHWHCLPIATCLLSNDLLVSVQKRQGEPREERSRTNYANCRLSCSTLIPGSKMTRPEFLRVRVVPIQRAAWNRRTGAAFHYLRRGLVIIQPIIPV